MTDDRFKDYQSFNHDRRFLAQLMLEFIDSGFPGKIAVDLNQNGDILSLVVERYPALIESDPDQYESGEGFSTEYLIDRLNLNRVTGPDPSTYRTQGVSLDDIIDE